VPGAAEELWRTFAPRMLGVARGLLGARRAHLAPDIVQRVMLDVLRLPAARIQGVRDVGAFLAVATRNATFNMLRGENREVLRIREAARRAHMEQRQDIVWETNRELADALATLSEEHRELIVLRHFVGLSFDELAEAMDEARSTLSSRYAKAKELLRERLELVASGESGAKVDVKPERKPTLRPETKTEAHADAGARGQKATSVTGQSKIVGENK